MEFFKKYFLVFFINYALLVLTKVIFSFYLGFNTIYPVFWGYKFDFAVSGFVALLVMLFSFSKILSKFVFVGVTTAFFLLQISDMLYFSEAQRHIGYEINDFFTDMIPLVQTALNKYFLMSIFGFVMAGVVAFFLSKIDVFIQWNKRTFVSLLGGIALSVFFIRGEFQHIPLHPYQANEIGDVKLAQVALNGVYNVTYALIHGRKDPKMMNIPHPKGYKQIVASMYKTPKKEFYSPYQGEKPNVILFFAESWSAKWLQPYGFDKETTPNFNAMYKEGLHVKYMVAQGHRTTEGIFATLTSFPNPLGKSVAKTRLQSYQYDSMIFLFNKAGYESIFFQGTSKDTSGTGSLAQSLGFHKSYGKRDVKQKKYPENYWGVQDDDLYDFVLTKLPKNKPFIIGINGATTHDSVVPKSFATKKFVKDEKRNKELNALYFADYALGKFVKKIKKRYPNTIFVFFADHCGGGISGVLDNYKIPFVIYGNKIKPQSYDVVLSQLDIAPSVVDLVFGDYKKFLPNATGKSLFSDTAFFAPYFHNGILGWVENDRKIEYNLQSKSVKCEGKDKQECKSLKVKALSFTFLTQELLFEGKTREFHVYKK